MNKFLKLLIPILLIGNTFFCKHDKNESNYLELLSILQMLSGFSLPGPTPEWTRLFGKNGSGIQSNAIASDSNNNIYITGQVSASIDGQTLAGSTDLFVTKYNSSGVKQWTRLLGIAGDGTIAYGITSDSSNNIYTVGTTNGALDGEVFTGTPDFVDQNLFITKYDSNGNKQWTKLLGIGAGGNVQATGVTTDSSGNLFVTGTSPSGLDGLTFTGGGFGYFIVKYNSAGTKQWTKLYAGPQPMGIAYDNLSNKIYLTGLSSGTTPVNGVTVTGTYDSFLIQLDMNGNLVWTKLTGATNKDTRSNALSIDSLGSIYLTGTTTGSIGDQVNSGGLADLLILKFDTNGNRIWSRQLGFTGNIFALSNMRAEGKGISVGKNQDLYITGYTTGNLDKQAHSDPSNSKHNVFITKYDLNGNKIWTSISGTKGFYSDPNSITVDQQGHPYINGNTNGSLNGEIPIGSSSNLFIIKY
ncbi:SBBP repeat-containing protein [Leptospira kmetyi]|uniref:Beta-propeller repeat protein n=1 Tax=Leptospira kmetyi TaxID=408139 RepID=A0ABX4N802_9LEPT|nr:SBBP repeat-containing protein [Leptospira kmetyi]PJZ29503.1 hypothetical protein CH378_12525 [Leptospira kmetyi]PJZ39953.1 hypothetical protein CH370_18680 [Leptospira kmetyi]